MTAPLLLIDTADGVRTIRVNRPDKLNALNAATLDALDAAFANAASDDAVRVVVLSGSGSKAFVAGADIAEMNGLTPVQGRDFSLRGTRMMRRVERLPKPVIAMVNGFALGGGLELAMCCHLRIAADTAKVGQPEINLGLIPGFGGSQRLLRLCGRAATLELCLTGAPVSAERALQLGNGPPPRRWPCAACWIASTPAANAGSRKAWSTNPCSSAWCSPPRTCAKAPRRSWKSASRHSPAADGDALPALRMRVRGGRQRARAVGHAGCG
jgi:hypothetical protein